MFLFFCGTSVFDIFGICIGYLILYFLLLLTRFCRFAPVLVNIMLDVLKIVGYGYSENNGSA